MDSSIHRVYGYVSEDTFYRMLQRARLEEVFVDEAGRVDIGDLISELVTTYAEGRYCILPEKGMRNICKDEKAPDKVPTKKKTTPKKKVETV
jgi:hypothetical protein